MTKKSTRVANKSVTRTKRRPTATTTTATTETTETTTTIKVDTATNDATTSTRQATDTDSSHSTTTIRRRSQRTTNTNNTSNTTNNTTGPAAAAVTNSRRPKRQRSSQENKSTTRCTVDNEVSHTPADIHLSTPATPVATRTLPVTPATSSPVVATDSELLQSCCGSSPASISTDVAAAGSDTTLDRKNKSVTSSGECDNNKSILITCGDETALLYLGVTSKQRCRDKCVQYNDQWLTPNEFQSVCGRSAAKDWKRTIKHGGQCVKTLLTQGVLIIDGNTASCHCKHCLTQNTKLQQAASASASHVTKSVDSEKKTSRNKGLNNKNNKKHKQKELKTQEQVDDNDQQQQQQQHSEPELSCDLVADIKCEQQLVSAINSTQQCEVGIQETDPVEDNDIDSNTASDTENTKATKLSHLSRIINELKQNKMKMSSNVNKTVVKTDVDCKQRPVTVDDCTNQHLPASSVDSTSTLETMQSTTFPTFPPFYGLNPAQLAALSPAQLASMSAPFQMQYPPPYIFMGFPLNPQLLQSYPLTSAQLAGSTLGKRKHEPDHDRLTSAINLTHRSQDVSYRSPVDLSGSKVTAHGSVRQCTETDECGALNLSGK